MTKLKKTIEDELKERVKIAIYYNSNQYASLDYYDLCEREGRLTSFKGLVNTVKDFHDNLNSDESKKMLEDVNKINESISSFANEANKHFHLVYTNNMLPSSEQYLKLYKIFLNEFKRDLCIYSPNFWL